MTPPFSYYGGKQRIIRHIIPHVPQHTVYVEPFCGGATLLFAKPDYRTKNRDDYREVINDTNKDIHNFFVQLRDSGEELCRMLELSLYSRTEYALAKKHKSEDAVLKAYYFYVNIIQAFSNNLSAGWGTAVFGKNDAIDYKNKTNKLNNYIDRMRSVYVECEDAIDCIKRWDSPQSFFYCDPPYPGTRQGHYEGYTQEDYNNLVGTLNNCEGSFILSCYSNETVPDDTKKYEFETITSAARNKVGNKKRTECIWVRGAKGIARKEILKIYEKQNRINVQQQLTFS